MCRQKENERSIVLIEKAKNEIMNERESIPHVGNFEKVSFAQFKKDLKSDLGEADVFNCWDGIKLPSRATSGSEGYDFYCPQDIVVPGDGKPVTIKTGIRVKTKHGWVLLIVPRSSLGFKYGVRLVNTVGVIDEDFAYSDNEGHIMIRIKKDADGEPLLIRAGDRFAQGLFLPIGITDDDNATAVRNGGIGSTGL